MDLNQAIANLLSQDKTSQSQSSTLSETIAEIIDRTSEEKTPNSEAKQEAEDIFEQLTQAARSQQSELFDELVKAEQQQASSNEITLLMSAVMAERLEVIEALIAAGADVNAKITQVFKFNALDFAIKHENIAIVRALLEAGADPNWSNANPGFSPIVKAIKKNNTELVRLLLEYNASIEFDTGLKLLVEAAKHDNPPVIQLLLEAGCKVNETNSSGFSALRQACISCNVEVIKVLLAAGAEFSPSGADFLAIFSAPFVAKQMSRLLGQESDPVAKIPLAVQAMIDGGADLNVQGQDNTTPLILAVSAGYLEVVQMLLAAGANPNLQGKRSGWLSFQEPDREPLVRAYSQPTTPLNLAVAFGYREIAQVLIDCGADIHLADDRGNRAIAIAIKEGHQNIVQLLQDAGAQVSLEAAQGSAEALLGAAKQGNLEILRSCLVAEIDPNTSQSPIDRWQRYKTALMFAAEGGYLEAVKLLVDSGADVNLSDRPGKKLGKTPLMWAAIGDRAQVVRFLLEAGATVDAQDKRGQTALFYAVEENSAAAVEVLLEFGADPHKKNWDGTPFEYATYAGKNINQLIIAADRKQPSSASNAAREEMLCSAAFNGDADLVRNLIQEGVNINARDEDGDWTALMSAAATGNLTIVQLLLAAGADVNLGATSGQTALSETAYWGHTEIVNLLISAGADLNVADLEDGWTPLMKTIAFGNKVEIFQILLDAGADATLKDNEGKTLLQLALECEQQAIVELLHRAGITE